jgi:transposase
VPSWRTRPCPPPTPAPLRQSLWQLVQQGLSAGAIARSLRLSLRTVYRLRARFRPAGQPCAPAYDRCGRPPAPHFRDLRPEVLALRRLHRGWGAGRIRVQLRQQHPKQPLPDLSTIRRWLARAGLAPPPATPATPAAPRARCPHQIRQADASERLSLRSGQRVCWLRVVDEATGAVLDSQVFAQGRWAEVEDGAVQQALRHGFARWGRPEGLRVDNGGPWTCPQGSLPSPVELWLAGLGIALHRNPPRRPQANGVVERSQRTAQAWAEPGQCDTPEQLQRRLDEEDRIQRECLPFRDGRSRWQVYPELCHSGRGYALGTWEEVCWDLGAALECLARHAVWRKVDRSGAVSLYDHRLRVGMAYAGAVIRVSFAKDSGEWVFASDGQEVGRAAAGITAAGICQLRLSRRPGRSARRTQARRAQQERRAGPGPGGPGTVDRPAPPGGG